MRLVTANRKDSEAKKKNSHFGAIWLNNWKLNYLKRTILKYFVEGKVKENFKKGYFSNILVLTSLSYIIEITKETFIFETFFHFSPNKNFHFNLYLMNTIQITRYIEWISLFFFYSSFWSLPASRVTQYCTFFAIFVQSAGQ